MLRKSFPGCIILCHISAFISLAAPSGNFPITTIIISICHICYTVQSHIIYKTWKFNSSLSPRLIFRNIAYNMSWMHRMRNSFYFSHYTFVQNAILHDFQFIIRLLRSMFNCFVTRVDKITFEIKTIRRLQNVEHFFVIPRLLRFINEKKIIISSFSTVNHCFSIIELIRDLFLFVIFHFRSRNNNFVFTLEHNSMHIHYK